MAKITTPISTNQMAGFLKSGIYNILFVVEIWDVRIVIDLGSLVSFDVEY